MLINFKYYFSTLHLRESGLVEKWYKQFWPKPKSCNSARQLSLTLEDLSALCITFCILIILSVIVLLLEITKYNIKHAQTKRIETMDRMHGRSRTSYVTHK